MPPHGNQTNVACHQARRPAGKKKRTEGRTDCLAPPLHRRHTLTCARSEPPRLPYHYSTLQLGDSRGPSQAVVILADRTTPRYTGGGSDPPAIMTVGLPPGSARPAASRRQNSRVRAYATPWCSSPARDDCRRNEGRCECAAAPLDRNLQPSRPVARRRELTVVSRSRGEASLNAKALPPPYRRIFQAVRRVYGGSEECKKTKSPVCSPPPLAKSGPCEHATAPHLNAVKQRSHAASVYLTGDPLLLATARESPPRHTPKKKKKVGLTPRPHMD